MQAFMAMLEDGRAKEAYEAARALVYNGAGNGATDAGSAETGQGSNATERAAAMKKFE